MKRTLSIAVFMIFFGGIVSGLFAQEKINFEFKGDVFDKWHPDSLAQKRDVSVINWYEPEIITAYSLSGDTHRLVNEYDSRGFMTKSTKQIDYLGIWIDSEMTEYYYSGDLLSTFITFLIQGGIPLNYQQGSYYFNVGNHLIESQIEIWSNDKMTWLPFITKNYEYESDFSDKIIEELYTQHDYFYDPETGIETEYISAFKYDYQYDNQNRISEKTWRQKLDNGNWENRTNYLFEYHENGKIESIAEQEWDKTAWWNKFRMFNEYDDLNRKDVEYRQHWYGMEWRNSLCHDYTYNDRGELISDIYKSWYISDWINISKEDYTYLNDDISVCETFTWFSSRWLEEYKFEYEYDAHHNASKGLAFSYVQGVWNEADLTILMRYNGRKSSYKYESCYKVETSYKEAQQPLNRIDDLEKSISVYPNPTSGKLKIERKKSEIKNVQVFDMTGRALSTIENINTVDIDIDLTNFSSGIYFIEIDGTTVKIVKQ